MDGLIRLAQTREVFVTKEVSNKVKHVVWEALETEGRRHHKVSKTKTRHGLK